MRISLNSDWTFRKEGSQEEVKLRVPHDAMLAEQRCATCRNGAQTGYFPGGKYSYERTFDIDAQLYGRELVLFFEGVYQNCHVYLNGEEVGAHRYGYTEFGIDITRVARAGSNALSVSVDNSLEPNCRWYSGSGIYRPVWLLVDELRAPRIVTRNLNPAVLEIEADGDIEILDGNESVYRGKPGRVTIEDARLWSDEMPYLYTLVTHNGNEERRDEFGIRLLAWSAETGLTVNGERVLLRGGCIHHDNGILGACGFEEAEERRVRILKAAGYNAIRSAHNPMSRAMLSACDRLGMYVMDECFDGWYTPKTYHDYARYFERDWRDDLTAMVRKDVNHPCVLLYSIGNEVSETATDRGVETCAELAAHVRELDPTRPVTCGINVLLNVYTRMGIGVYKDKGEYKAEPLPENGKAYSDKKTGSAFFNMMAQKLGGLMFFMSSGKKGDNASKGAASKLDIIGYNYAGSRFDDDVQNYPRRMMVASETMVTDLPYNWERVKKYPAIIGDFAWAAWDYLGEAGVGDWLYHSYKGLPLLAGSGTIDTTGKITAEAYFQQIVWGLRKKPWIGVQPLNHSGETPTKSAWRFTNALDSWTWHGFEGKETTVDVFADAAAVRLELNGSCVGTQKIRDYRTKFRLAYAPGTLVAIALDASGKELGRHSLKTGGSEAVLSVRPETAVVRVHGIAFVPIEFTDASGKLLPYVELPVTVRVSGNATLKGLGSALCKTDESYLTECFTSYRGRLLAAVQAGDAPGSIRITASCEGMEPVTAEISVVSD